MSEEKERVSGESHRAPTPAAPVAANTINEKQEPASPALHPSVYVIVWISLSSGVILFNKWLLATLGFKFPIVLTTWHMIFATFMTQLLARTSTLLDGRKTVKMTGKVYLRAIVPIGFFFSMSLICGNKTYLYLSVAFIQMLKATTPVAVLLASWALGVAPVNFKTLGNVSLIVIGVIIASIGEIDFQLIGFLYQLGGIVFEAVRLVMVQRLLSSAEYKMDPLVSLYYFAPVCAVMNGFVALFTEVPELTLQHITNVGPSILLANAVVAFLLNVSVVFLIGKTSSLVLTLCGVLKDVLLVIASMIIWGTQVSGTQFFGYSIALGGLMYYKLGADQLKQYASSAGRSWSEFGAERPIARRVVTIFLVIFSMFVVLGSLGPHIAPAQAKQVQDLMAASMGRGG